MRYYTHIVASILAFLIFAYLFNIKQENLLAGILITSIVSVMPDLIDTIIHSGHRGFGHSLLLWIPIIAIFGIVSIFTNNLIIVPAIITAIVSHVILDLITMHGYPFLYPNKTILVGLGEKKRIKTGTKTEKATFIFLIMLLIPALLFSFGILTLASPLQVQESPNNNLNDHGAIKDNVNVNIDGRMKNKNITVKKVTENETQILVQNIE